MLDILWACVMALLSVPSFGGNMALYFGEVVGKRSVDRCKAELVLAADDAEERWAQARARRDAVVCPSFWRWCMPWVVYVYMRDRTAWSTAVDWAWKDVEKELKAAREERV